MQRRAAAIYFLFFLVVGAGAYAYIGVAEQAHEPQYDLDGELIESNGSATIDGTDYSLNEITREEGSHGEEGDIIAELSWTNDSYVYTASIENNSTADYQNDSYRVVIENETGVSEFTLRAEQNVTAILQDDPAVDNGTVTRNGEAHVVYADNDTLRPLDTYLPAPETIQFAEGDTYSYEDNETAITNVTTQAIHLEWTGPKTNTVEYGEGNNATLANGETYFANFHGEESVKISPSSQYGGYATTNAELSSFQTRLNGLWGITIFSGIAAVIMLSTAYLPVRG